MTTEERYEMVCNAYRAPAQVLAKEWFDSQPDDKDWIYILILLSRTANEYTLQLAKELVASAELDGRPSIANNGLVVAVMVELSEMAKAHLKVREEEWSQEYRTNP